VQRRNGRPRIRSERRPRLGQIGRGGQS